MADITQHNREIARNRERWQRKPVLRQLYAGFYRRIAAYLVRRPGGAIVELGSGIGAVREVIPECVRTDLFANPWIDRVENAYRLTFADASVSDLILFDVFHHLRYPGTALGEWRRVLVPGGRVILFEPCVSGLGWVVYGLCHPEPLALGTPLTWLAPAGWQPEQADYYAAQGNAWRIFHRGTPEADLSGWLRVRLDRLSALAYVASGGYSKAQLYPAAALPCLRALERLGDLLPVLCATRLLVVLEKREEELNGQGRTL